MNIIDIEKAKSESWDVIIAGTSFAAFFFARYLPRKLRVLFVEKGGITTHQSRIAAQRHDGLETIAQKNNSENEKRWIAHSTFGGNSNCWWACTPRLHPHDFGLFSRYGVGSDWPVTYDDLEDIYCDVEEVMEISGGGSDHLLPRSRPFPSPPHAFSRSDKALQAHSRDWFAQPTARSNGTRRPVCCANGVCHLCPVDSKFTILNSLDLFERPRFFLLPRTEVRRVQRTGTVATALTVRTSDHREHTIKGDLVALGANALFNSAILLRSGFENLNLGKYIHEQISQIVLVDVDTPNYFGGTSITGHGYPLYAGDHRKHAGAVLIENWNSPPSIRTDRGRWTDRLKLKFIAEDLPRAENRVVLRDDEPIIEWFGHHDYAYRGLERAHRELKNILPFKIESIEVEPVAKTEAHIQGTTRMGRNADTGVVDSNLATFEARNVLALGAGCFPSSSPANPTLTLSALSVRAARALS